MQALIFFFAYAILFPLTNLILFDKEFHYCTWVSKSNLIQAFSVTIIFIVLIKLFPNKK